MASGWSSELQTPSRIETDRLVIRCWEPEDAAELKRAIDASIDHLLPWMPWVANEPEPLPEKTARLTEFKAMFERNEDFIYGIFNTDGEVVGGTGLHPRTGPEAREIGYWVAHAHEGKGVISESTAALTRVGFEVLALDRIEIHCDPRNSRSAAVPKRLGYEHEATLRRRLVEADGSFRDVMIWSLFADGYGASPSAAVAVRAFGPDGDALLL
jgi:RimJ/RimL family protein N-acetyltransferase